MQLGLRHKLVFALELSVLTAGLVAGVAFPEARWPLAALTVGVAVIVWAIWLITAASVRSALGRVRRVADAIADGDSSRRVSVGPADDVAKIARSINRMAERLEAAEGDRLRLEQQLQQHERLATLGELAATVAHEVNNPLDGVQNCARIARRHLHEPHRLRELLDLMDTGLYRIESIMKRLLHLSRKQPVRLIPTALCTIVRDATAALESRIRRQRVDLTTDVPDDSLYVLADGPLLVQALINVMVNAVEAMPDGGRLRVVVSPPDADRAVVTVSVSDSGCGLSAEEKRRIFEPFYTTKAETGGTGLGLGVVAQIMEAHHGRIKITSKPGRGTTCIFEIPWSATATDEHNELAEPMALMATGGDS